MPIHKSILAFFVILNSFCSRTQSVDVPESLGFKYHVTTIVSYGKTSSQINNIENKLISYNGMLIYFLTELYIFEKNTIRENRTKVDSSSTRHDTIAIIAIDTSSLKYAVFDKFKTGASVLRKGQFPDSITKNLITPSLLSQSDIPDHELEKIRDTVLFNNNYRYLVAHSKNSTIDEEINLDYWLFTDLTDIVTPFMLNGLSPKYRKLGLAGWIFHFPKVEQKFTHLITNMQPCSAEEHDNLKWIFSISQKALKE